MNKKIGILGYNYDTDRYGILSFDLWENDGLHCGEVFEIYLDGKWLVDRIEYKFSKKEWYLVYSKLSNDELEDLKIRY